LLRVQVDYPDAVLPQPVDAAVEVDGFADDHGADVELPDQPATVPARRQRRDHDLVTVAALPAGVAEGVGFAVDGGILLLHAAVVPAAEDTTLPLGQATPDGNAAFGQT